MTRLQIGDTARLHIETRYGPTSSAVRITGRTYGPSPRYDVIYPTTPEYREENIDGTRLTKEGTD